MRIFVGLCWGVTVLCTVFAAFMLLTAHADTAIQQAAIAAQSVAIVVIPYVFTRAFDGIAIRARSPEYGPRSGE